ncbi:toxin-antitoxin system YwqK family antitoxin [Flavobacterium sp. NKUCC04_CG]|uniref:toxin-antitoxin system YwqK family antitoxin n=1 Tax=Flavobacterium sp. NKUCC04_CG TaxID=2842121 RepID=UPI001C5BA655|nr:toxin-antitoxin system YwqK family antitoxin [Flavobacterium sp. NKUCC04_CG]MBW3518625.1 toxin-antitoxin system YwqK family antitoxin [Flavobacterium sp. NKUCC04_CG]
MTKYLLLVLALLFFGCKNSDFDDASKRNEDWVYWIDDKTGEGFWIRTGKETTAKDGVYYMFYYNGKIYEKGKLKDKRIIDTVFVYGINEELIRYKVITPDTTREIYVKNGGFIEYYQNGSVYQKGTVTDNKFKDDWIRYYKNGQPEWVQDFVNNTGVVTWYFENGGIKDISNWKNDLEDGVSTSFFANGQMDIKLSWKKGIKEGKSEIWYDSGIKKSIRYFKNDTLEGPYQQWTIKGQIEAEGIYVKGQFSGVSWLYHDNGAVAISGNRKSDKLDGLLEKFDEKGNLIKSFYFENGVRIE